MILVTLHTPLYPNAGSVVKHAAGEDEDGAAGILARARGVEPPRQAWPGRPAGYELCMCTFLVLNILKIIS